MWSLLLLMALAACLGAPEVQQVEKEEEQRVDNGGSFHLRFPGLGQDFYRRSDDNEEEEEEEEGGGGRRNDKNLGSFWLRQLIY